MTGSMEKADLLVIEGKSAALEVERQLALEESYVVHHTSCVETALERIEEIVAVHGACMLKRLFDDLLFYKIIRIYFSYFYNFFYSNASFIFNH
jgi:hypothetical protein